MGFSEAAAAPSSELPSDAQMLSIGLFVQAAGQQIPAAVVAVRTVGFASPGRGAAVYRADAAVDRAFVRAHPRTAFLSADGRGFEMASRIIDVSQTGATGDGATDDTGACQAALDMADANGGGTVIIPPGDYRITRPLRLPGTVALLGAGQASRLRVVGCDGIVIAPSDAIGPRRVADLWLHGEGGERFAAIVCDLAPPARAQGLVFEHVYASFFGTGVRARGLWHATFRSVTLHNVLTGFAFVDRNVKILLDDVRATRGDLIAGAGATVGLQVGDGAHPRRPEDVQVIRSIFFGFDKAIVWRNALFGSVSGCDLDACGEVGLELVTADGGFTFRDNWVQVDAREGTTTFGIRATALGYAPEPGRVTLADNRIGAEPARAGNGIFIGTNQSHLLVSGNSVTGWSEGLRIDAAAALTCRDNWIGAAAWIGHTRRLIWENNLVNRAITWVSNVELKTDEPPGR